MTTESISGALIDLQIKRKFAIKLANRQINSVRSLARRYCDFRWDSDEAERAKVNKRAADIVSRAMAGKGQQDADRDIAEIMEAEYSCSPRASARSKNAAP
jgi:hypothetical protein